MSSFMQSINRVLHSGIGNKNICDVSPNSNNLGTNKNNISNINATVSKNLVAAAGFNVEAPIVNAIIGNITGTLPTKKNESNETIKCTVCDCEITSKVIWTHHLNGARHKKKLKALNIMKQLKKEKGIHFDSGDSAKLFVCEICCLTVNSAQQLEFHLQGVKHKRNVAKINCPEMEVKTASGSNDDVNIIPPVKKKKKQEPKIFVCDICNIAMNSQCQYDQHLSAKKHKQKTLKANITGQNWNQATVEFHNQGSFVRDMNYVVNSETNTVLCNMNNMRHENCEFFNYNNASVVGF